MGPGLNWYQVVMDRITIANTRLAVPAVARKNDGKVKQKSANKDIILVTALYFANNL